MYLGILGLLLGIAASVLWALTPPLVKICVDVVKNPFIVNGLRLASSLIAYGLALLMSPINYYVDSYALTFIVLSAIIGPGLGDIAYVIAIDMLGPGLTVIISYQYILISQVLSLVILRHEEGALGLILAPIALIGVYIALRDEKAILKVKKLGVLSAITAAFLWASSLTIISYLVNDLNIDPFTISLIRTIVLTPIIMSIGLLRPEHVVKIKYLGFWGLVALVTSGITAYFGGVVLFITAVSMCGVLVAITNALTPIITQILSSIIVHERVSKNKVIGSLVVSLAIGLTALSYMI